MEEIMKYSGPDILKMVDNYAPGPEKLAMWWLGQSGFAVKSHNTVLYLDPYLSTRLERRTKDKPLARHIRMMPPPVNPHDIKNADYIICSHNHGDHLDPETVIPMLESSERAKLVVPPAAVSAAIAFGIGKDRIISVGVGDHVRLGDLTVEAVPGKHNEFDFDPVTGYPYVGFIIKFNNITIYHAGDTIYYHGIEEWLNSHAIDIALLPINGGEMDRVKRGFMSNLQFWEAADLAAQLKVKLVIPVHYDMFTINIENVERFEYYMEKKYPWLKYTAPVIGEPIEFDAGKDEGQKEVTGI